MSAERTGSTLKVTIATRRGEVAFARWLATDPDYRAEVLRGMRGQLLGLDHASLVRRAWLDAMDILGEAAKKGRRL